MALLSGEQLLVVGQVAQRLGDLAVDACSALQEHLSRAGHRIAAPGAQPEIEADVAKHLAVLCGLLGIEDVPPAVNLASVVAFLGALVDSEGLGHAKLTVEVARNAFDILLQNVEHCVSVLAPGMGSPYRPVGAWTPQRFDLSDDIRIEVGREGRYLYAGAHQQVYHLAQQVRYVQMGLDPAIAGVWSDNAAPLLRTLAEATDSQVLSPLVVRLPQVARVLSDLEDTPGQVGDLCADAGEQVGLLAGRRSDWDSRLEALVHEIGDIY